MTAAQVNGTWKYRANIFKIWALGQQKLKVEFEGIYEYKTPSGPMANMGSGSGIARIEGDTAIFKPSELELDEECRITMRFTKGKLVVEQQGICGFGLNVNASGTYRKVSRSKPKFGESALKEAGRLVVAHEVDPKPSTTQITTSDALRHRAQAVIDDMEWLTFSLH